MDTEDTRILPHIPGIQTMAMLPEVIHFKLLNFYSFLGRSWIERIPVE